MNAEHITRAQNRQWGLYFVLFALYQLLLFCLGVSAAGMATTSSLTAQANDDLTGYTLLAVWGFLAMITAPAVLMVGLVAGFGMRGERRWARTAAIIGAAFSLAQIPIGTLFGIVALRFLMSQPVKELYLEWSRR